jgi:hypothetical protein
VKGFGANTGTFSVGIQAIHEDPCDGGVHTSRAPSHCRFVLPLIHFIPDSPMYSVPLFLKRQCNRTLGVRITREAAVISFEPVGG